GRDSVARLLRSAHADEPERPQACRIDLRLRELMPMLAPMLRADIEPRLEIEPGLWPVLAIGTAFDDVVLNLAANARDALPQSGHLLIRAANRPGVPDQVAVEVIDDGTGMDEATLARAVEPFFTTKPLGSGTGLGLTGAHAFAQRSGGSLTIESRPGAGTTVRLLLPRAV
ncbi:MAG: hypothetical protein FJX46_11515, partial [Alphaproteobacteria bacterium]|nr:hypothetical protein [Alphaproteobacteria bacterium]